MTKRGIVYYVWGKYNKTDLNKSIESLKKFGYDYHVHHDKSDKLAHLQKKVGMFDVSPFETTLFLDTDTIVKDNLDYGFEMAEKYELACSIAPASVTYPWLKGEMRNFVHKDLPQYNTGVIFFTRNTEAIFKRWRELLTISPESKNNDQPQFSQAVYENLNPYILPKNWNYRPHVRFEHDLLFGKLKILHSNRTVNPNVTHDNY